MKKKLFIRSFNKPSVALLIIALVVGGISAQATGLLNSPSGGYLVCVNSKTKAITHPGTSTCPNGSKKLVLGAQGIAGADGKTLWNGVKDPESTLGAPGDMFINTTTKTLFGPKDLATSWPAGVSMVGPAGPQGPGGSGGAGSTGATGATGAAGSNATLTCAQGGTCVVGNTGPGGVYVNEEISPMRPWRYLEAAPAGWAGFNPDEVTTIWCNNNALINLTTGDPVTGTFTSNLIGSGSFNSKVMMASCAGSAAHFANLHHGGGKFDWYLPSLDELTELYSKRELIGGFQNGDYWSSTEAVDNVEKAQVIEFDNNGSTNNLNKLIGTPYIRAIRAF